MISSLAINFAAQRIDPKKVIKNLFGIEPTTAKVQRCYLISMGILVALCISPMTVLCLATSIAGAYYLIKDYEDPKEVERMRKKALSSDFLSIIKDHGSILPVLEAKILTKHELSKKLDRAISVTKDDPILQDQLCKYKKQIGRKRWFDLAIQMFDMQSLYKRV